MSPPQSNQNTGCGKLHRSWLGALWTLPNTILGCLFALGSSSIPRPSKGILVAQTTRGLANLFLVRGGFAAITLGYVVITVVPLTARLRMHEEHHVRQYSFLGPFFLPIYLFLALFYGYERHPMERSATDCEERSWKKLS